MKQLFRHPLFITGLAVKLVLIAGIVPYAVQHWYAPFLQNSLTQFNPDPWTTYLASNGDRLAFPYGYAMWLSFLPLTAIAVLSKWPVAYAYSITLLIADIALLCALRWLADIKDRRLLVFYWLSPIMFFATYWLGFNDVIPVLLIILGLSMLRDRSIYWAAIFIALAVSAKFSMVLVVPFILIYLFRNKRLRIFLVPFAMTLGAALLVLQVPYLLSSGGRVMLFDNPEVTKIYDIFLSIGNGLEIYILPLVYLLVLFGAWRVRRMSFELLISLLGVAFFIVLLLTPAAPGWFVWLLPFLALYECKSDRISMILGSVFSVLYIGLSVWLAPLPNIKLAHWPSGEHLIDLITLPERVPSLWQTFLLATGLIIISRMLRESFQANEYFRLSRKPFVIGIAGDSGSGKDTLTAAIADLFGAHSVAQVSGDDYHLWDRQKPMWQVMTHLNPRANDLSRFAQDVQRLADGRSIHSRHYDHTDGKMSKPHVIKSNDVILVSGLHAFSLPLLRTIYDLKIYMDMDEDLRRYFKLRRDVGQRGHQPSQVMASLERREPDSERFIRPQVAQADLVLSLCPVSFDALIGDPSEDKAAPRLKLHVQARQGLYYNSLVRVLIGVCGLHVDITEETSDGAVSLVIEGDITAEDIALAAREMLPQLHELLDIHPVWQDGMLGLMQLIVLTHITQALRARLL